MYKHITQLSDFDFGLAKRKLSIRWMPRLLTTDQKRNRMITSQECLASRNCIPGETWCHFKRLDKSRVYHNIVKSKQHLKETVGFFPGELGPKKAKVSLSANQVMLENNMPRYWNWSTRIWKKKTGFDQRETSLPPTQCRSAHVHCRNVEM